MEADASVFEVQSFVEKFRHLCSLGFNANLHFEAFNGRIVANFQADLGYCFPPPLPPVYSTAKNIKSSRRNSCSISAKKQTKPANSIGTQANIENHEKIDIEKTSDEYQHTTLQNQIEALGTQIDNLQEEINVKEQTIQCLNSKIERFDPFKRMSKLLIQQAENTIIPSVLPNNSAIQPCGGRRRDQQPL